MRGAALHCKKKSLQTALADKLRNDDCPIKKDDLRCATLPFLLLLYLSVTMNILQLNSIVGE